MPKISDYSDQQILDAVTVDGPPSRLVQATLPIDLDRRLAGRAPRPALVDGLEEARLDAAVARAVHVEQEDRVEFDHLRGLAEREALLTVEHLPAEYEGIIGRLVERVESESKQRLMKELVSKPREELTDEDKEMIRNLTRSGARVGRQG